MSISGKSAARASRFIAVESEAKGMNPTPSVHVRRMIYVDHRLARNDASSSADFQRVRLRWD
jgi:hypothetical protein